jgi:ankyrin repeat protein
LLEIDDHGWTALHHAASLGHERVADELLRSETQRLHDSDEQTESEEQADADNLEFLRQARKFSILSIRDKLSGATPLHIGATSNHKEIVRMLIEAGSDINLTDDFGERALDCVSLRGEKGRLLRSLLQP